MLLAALTLLTRHKLLTVLMLVLCAVAALTLVRSDVVECLVGKWATFRQPKKLDVDPDFGRHRIIDPDLARRRIRVDEQQQQQEPHLLLSDLSDATSDAADVSGTGRAVANAHPAIVECEESATEEASQDYEYKTSIGEACSANARASAPKVPQKRAPRKPRKSSSS
jgi:hypothetical protein